MIEVTTFALLDGTRDEVFLAADARMQTAVAYRQPGLLRRVTARGVDGRWLVLTVWASEADADAAAAAQAATPAVAAAAFEALVDGASRRTERFAPLD